MALDRERLLKIAYQLLEEPGWPQGSDKSSPTAVSTVANIFREFARLPANTDRLHQALSLIEKLPESPLARYSMPGQYRGILTVLRVRNGRVNHPDLKGLSFEELAYVIGWVNRLHRAVSVSLTLPPGDDTVQRRQEKHAAAKREGRPEPGGSGKLQGTSGKAAMTAKDNRGNTDDIDPRWAALKNWPGFKKTK
ncbi:hypothetical protein [Thermodesulfitimonas sp.]